MQYRLHRKLSYLTIKNVYPSSDQAFYEKSRQININLYVCRQKKLSRHLADKFTNDLVIKREHR